MHSVRQHCRDVGYLLRSPLHGVHTRHEARLTDLLAAQTPRGSASPCIRTRMEHASIAAVCNCRLPRHAVVFVQ